MGQDGKKDDIDKPQFTLMPQRALLEAVQILTAGAQHYGPENWRHVEPLHDRYLNAAMRHINQYLLGIHVDFDSGRHHLAHAMCSLAFIVQKDLESDDGPV